MEPSDLTVEMAGVRVAFSIDDPRLRCASRRRYKPFLSARAPYYRVDVKTFPPAPSRQVRPFWPMVSSDRSEFGFCRGDALLRLSRKDRAGTLRMWPNAYSFDAALRVLYSGLLTERRESAFFLHAAAALYRGRVLVFPGVSGAGKSTLVRHMKEARPLGDELIGIRRERGEFIAFSTPFWGNGKPPKARLRGRVQGLYFLKRNRTPGLSPVSPVEAQRKALKSLLWFPGQPAEALNRAWGEILRLVDSVPAYEFSFRKGSSPWPLLREAGSRAAGK